MENIMPKTLFDKIWENHTIKKLKSGQDLLFIDRHILHEVTTPQAYSGLRKAKRSVAQPHLTISFEDHVISTEPNRKGASFDIGNDMIASVRKNSKQYGITHFNANHRRQGIVHVAAPEQGIIQPGMTAVCGDSHTCTLGAMGSVAFGIGTSEVEHVLTTQTLSQYKPKNLRITIDGTLTDFVTAKDVILKLCQQLTVTGGTGYAIEYAGSFVRELPMDGRFTLCNMAIEMGAKIGLIKPDIKTWDYLKETRYAAPLVTQETLLHHWKQLYSDKDAIFDCEFSYNVADLKPQITWGVNPDQVIDIDSPIPVKNTKRAKKALAYMQLKPEEYLLEKPIDIVFIGSCTNSRISDLRSAADILKNNKVSKNTKVFIVPGSQAVKAQAEKEGIADIFKNAGCHWREPGCSMCASINREFVPSGQRCLSTSNRNFIGRQGPGSKTHLCSPIVAAASAITGVVTDPKALF